MWQFKAVLNWRACSRTSSSDQLRNIGSHGRGWSHCWCWDSSSCASFQTSSNRGGWNSSTLIFINWAFTFKQHTSSRYSSWRSSRQHTTLSSTSCWPQRFLHRIHHHHRATSGVMMRKSHTWISRLGVGAALSTTMSWEINFGVLTIKEDGTIWPRQSEAGKSPPRSWVRRRGSFLRNLTSSGTPSYKQKLSGSYLANRQRRSGANIQIGYCHHAWCAERSRSQNYTAGKRSPGGVFMDTETQTQPLSAHMLLRLRLKGLTCFYRQLWTWECEWPLAAWRMPSINPC